jgi:hypothetical protein
MVPRSSLLALLFGLVWYPYDTVGGSQVEMFHGSMSLRRNSGIGFLSSPQALQRNMRHDFACRKLPLSLGNCFTSQIAIKSASSKFFGFRTALPLKQSKPVAGHRTAGNRDYCLTKWTCLNQLNDGEQDDDEWEVMHSHR